MASPAPGEQNLTAQAGLKRKREEDESEIEIEAENVQDESSTKTGTDESTPDDHDLVVDDDDDDEQDMPDNNDANIGEYNADHPKHNESDEPPPPCAIYDDAIEDIEEKLVSIPDRIIDLLADGKSNSKLLKGLTSKAEKLSGVPSTEKIKIAILGGAGVGKSSLLNAVTGKVDLAKSLSGGQSCTCVPTEYQDAFPGQGRDFRASVEYLQPGEIRIQLKEILKDYNTYAFEYDEDWDDDARTTALKAHENAFKVLRTLFNDMPNFGDKKKTKSYLKESYEKGDSRGSDRLLDELVSNSESKLKHTAKNDYIENREARTLNKLKSAIDPLTTSSGTFDHPALWPLVREVRIGVRHSRLLEKVTLVDLPGISDTNQARVELTHDHIKRCDYVWVVAPIGRVVDDATIYQLLSRYGKAFKGMICVICTHSDADIVGHEQKMINMFKQEDQDIQPYLTLTEQMKAKKTEVTQLRAKISATNKRKKKTKKVMEDVRGEEDTLKELERQFARLVATRFEFIVKTRNALVTEQLQETMENHMPRGKVLTVYCVSNQHYAALKGVAIDGPRLSAQTTGIPQLRADTLALMAPRLLDTLEHYTDFSLQAALKDLQLWLTSVSIDRRPELIELTLQPKQSFEVAARCRLATFAGDIQSSAEKVLVPAISKASEEAIKQLAKKRKKHWGTIMAFVRKNGKHATRMCPKESWNENFSKHFAEIVTRSEFMLSQTRDSLTTKLEHTVIDDLTTYSRKIENFPADLPKEQLTSLIQTYIGGVHHSFRSDEEEYTKDIRNILLDVTQDSEKNTFSDKMKAVYQECVNDSGSGVTKRSLDRIEEFLKKEGKNSAFAIVARRVTAKFHHTDEKHMKKVQARIDGLLRQLYESVDELLENKIVDESEAAVRAELQELLPMLLFDWKQASQELQAVKAKYEGSK